MTDRPLEKYEYQLLKEGELDGHPVWIIQSTPVDDDEIDETGYTKSVQFVRKDNYVVIQAKIWVKKGKRNKGLHLIRRAIAADPNCREGHECLAAALTTLGRFDEAQRIRRQIAALAGQPRDSDDAILAQDLATTTPPLPDVKR